METVKFFINDHASIVLTAAAYVSIVLSALALWFRGRIASLTFAILGLASVTLSSIAGRAFDELVGIQRAPIVEASADGDVLLVRSVTTVASIVVAAGMTLLSIYFLFLELSEARRRGR
jgi:hypothetical protein